MRTCEPAGESCELWVCCAWNLVPCAICDVCDYYTARCGVGGFLDGKEVVDVESNDIAVAAEPRLAGICVTKGN